MKRAFTIVELLVVIIVLAILAALTIVSFSGITAKARQASLQADLSSNAKMLQLYQTQYGTYPTALDANDCPSAPTADTKYCLKESSNNTLASYTGSATTFTLGMNTGSSYYKVTESAAPVAYTPVLAANIQTITSTNCPTTRTRAVDARDNHTYWVQKLADGKCWMLTNLAYAGGGTNTYGDVKTLTNGTGGSPTFTVASYYVVPSTTNFTTEPTDPSTSTDGTGQYGYLYNFCGANGGQTGNGACSDTSSTAVNTTISVCPAGWRLPVGNGGEIGALNTAINGGSTASDAGLRATWLGQSSGFWVGSFYDQGSGGYYWSSTQSFANAGYSLTFQSNYLSTTGSFIKNNGFAVRCVAN